MLLKIMHQTELTYSEFISESIMELRMVPRQEQDQHRLSFDLAIGPPTTVSSYFDWLGNTVHTFSVNMFHRQISIMATSVVETDRPRKEPERFRDIWPIPPEAYDYTTYDFLGFGGPIVDCPQLHDLAKLFGANRKGSARGTGAADPSSDRREVHVQKGDHQRRPVRSRIFSRPATASARISRI